MASSPDAVAYEYTNIGAPINQESPDAAAYEYINVGSFTVPHIIGRLVGYAAPRSMAAAYEYINVT